MTLQEKRKDLDVERQKRLLTRLVEELSRSDPELYYRSTSEVAAQIEGLIGKAGRLSLEDRQLLMRLSRRDIEVLLSLH
ncbi:hypothetical protein TL5118_02110 [Thalassovita autumnalis]|uniref:Uncharacterized protein n=1 Tax=Thalassovita autumnalis TaxID=2072972 RepID=A0A0P1FY27_9RHOB|nr:hypothetical protein [Thalassovita autumnalis]CUH67257.1 hypothetical protein TL5118_02110 [Thalassovita autumnalis]CUH73810.1 hypothetical protein TL5120_03625 [Thalassovita autumnalis]